MTNLRSRSLPRVRQSTANNPLGLEVGERIQITHRAFIEYDEEGNKKLHREEFIDPPKSCFVIRSVRKAEGKYRGGNRWGDDYPASLSVTKYHRLYVCVVSIDDPNPFLVHPDDVINP